jgi:N-acetylmuramoyl-L-alanine amidase
MEPNLRASGIRFTRNNPQNTLTQTIAESNRRPTTCMWPCTPTLRRIYPLGAGAGGGDLYYAPGSINGQRFAELLAENFKNIYPLPDKVRTLPTSSLGEVTKTNAPAVLIETAYHDNRRTLPGYATTIPAIARAWCAQSPSISGFRLWNRSPSAVAR